MQDEEIDQPLQEWLDAVDDQWRRTGLSGTARGRLRRDLESDVATALSSGAGTGDLTAVDPADFANQVAQAHGHAYQPVADVEPSLGGIAATVLMGALVGAGIAWFIIWPVLISTLSTASDNAAVVVLYTIGAATILVSSVVALRLRFGARASLSELVLPALVGMVLGCLAGLPATLYIAGALAYPTDLALVLFEALPMLGLAVCGIYLARRLAPRRPAVPTEQ